MRSRAISSSCICAAGPAERRGPPQQGGVRLAVEVDVVGVGHERLAVEAVDAVDDHRAEPHADAVLEGVGGLR